jgi:Na+-translocating ferredoxin:NAD+ oxidoreductase subunit B
MDNIYEQLRACIDKYSVGFVATQSGVELKILKRLFTEEEAGVYLAMTRKLETAETIATRLPGNQAEVGAVLERMTDKGLTFPATRGGRKYYAAAPFMHGFFEHQFIRKDKDRELSLLIEEYLKNGFYPKTGTLRTVPVHLEVDAMRPVAPYDDVRQIIMEKERIGVFPCACNFQTASIGQNCKRPHDMCMGFDFYAEYAIEEHGVGRWITQAEALGILDAAEEAGLVHQTGGNSSNTECICNCCPDCCTILRGYKALPNPAAIIHSNYYCTNDPKVCVKCGTCLTRCSMGAITLGEKSATINLERCIGCGLCTTTCSSGAMRLVIRPEQERRRPPSKSEFFRSSMDYYQDLKDK